LVCSADDLLFREADAVATRALGDVHGGIGALDHGLIGLGEGDTEGDGHLTDRVPFRIEKATDGCPTGSEKRPAARAGLTNILRLRGAGDNESERLPSTSCGVEARTRPRNESAISL